MNRGNAVVDQLRVEVGDIGVSSNGRTRDFESRYLGSTPRAPTTMHRLLAYLAIIAVILSCGQAPAELPPPRGAVAKLTNRMLTYGSINAWKRSGYYRQNDEIDLSLPITVAVAGDGTACILLPSQMVLWTDHTNVTCYSKWRFQRP